jgi:hypothetical protein
VSNLLSSRLQSCRLDDCNHVETWLRMRAA